MTTFYDTYDHEDGFGSLLGSRQNPHRGGDVPQPAGTPIPTYEPITITLNQWHPGLGWIAEGMTPAGRFIGFRHMNEKSPHALGAKVPQWGSVGRVGSTGSLASGAHLCTTNASGPGGVLGMASLVSDPWPYIAAALNRKPTSTTRSTQEEPMTVYQAPSPSGDPHIGDGWMYVQNADGPLRPVDNSEGSAIVASGAFIAQWHGKDIWSLATRVGLREYEPMPAGSRMANGTPLLGPGKLTGRVIFGA